MDWNQFLRSDDFRAYRKKQIEMIARHLKSVSYQLLTNGKVDLSSFQGKLEIIGLVMKFPATLTQDTETKDLLAVQLDEDTSNLAQYLIRQRLAE